MTTPGSVIINALLCYITLFIFYNLALTFINVSLPQKRIILPILTIAIIAFISKIGFNTSAVIHSVIIVICCAGCLHFFNQIDIIFSLIGSLLTYFTLTFGSFFLACPLIQKLSNTLPSDPNEFLWQLLALLEIIIPTFVLIILKKTRFSLITYAVGTLD